MRGRPCASKFVPELQTDNARPKRGLRNDELIRADEGAGVRIADVLAEDAHVPGILCNPE